jgi:predicted nuclease of predicted toxin-antitoxin system
MKILIDECLPAALKGTLAGMGHECQTVRQAGYGSNKNGELLTIAGIYFSPAIEISDTSKT